MRARRWAPVVVLTATLGLAGCTSGTDAVTTGDFQFVSPGGQTQIFYEGADRKKPGRISGPNLTEAGKTVTIDDYAGKVVVLNIWGSWCGPCRAEVDDLEKVYQQNKDSGVQLVGIDVQDGSQDSAADFARGHQLTYPSIYDYPSRNLLALKGLPKAVVPTTVVLDRQHRVAAVFLKQLLPSDLNPVVQRLAAEH